MFTSMSDIGFPSNIHNYNLNVNKKNPKKEEKSTDVSNKKELITSE
jgi:hypothetical protein